MAMQTATETDQTHLTASELLSGPRPSGRPWPRVLLAALILLAVAAGAVLGVPSALGATLSEAREELRAARSRLGEIQSELDQLTQQYSQAEARLYEIDGAIVESRDEIARSKADLARTENRRAHGPARRASPKPGSPSVDSCSLSPGPIRS